jgi:anti-sigma factor RsiW
MADYLAGELPANQRAAFDDHLVVCPNCRRYLRDYEDSITLGKAAFDSAAELPADVPSELVTAILAARARS